MLACFLFADVDIVAYDSFVVAVVHATTTVTDDPFSHVVVAAALAFASVDDVDVSYRN